MKRRALPGWTHSLERASMRVLVIGAGGSAGTRRGKFLVRKGEFVGGVDTGRLPAGDAPAPEVLRGVPDRRFVNAPAERCSVRRTILGERLIRYRGKDYALMGLYYVPRPRERPLPFFVLRSIGDGDRASVSVSLRCERRRLRPATAGRLAACVLTAMVLLASSSRFGSERHPSGPPPADRVALSTIPGASIERHRVDRSRPASPHPGRDRGRGAIMVTTAHHRLPATRPQPRLAAHRSRNKMNVSPRTAFYTVGFGTFRDRRLAEAMARHVRARGYRAIVTPAHAGARVLGHRYPTRVSAARMVRILRAIGLAAALELSNVSST
jgi:hypothetical protein